MTSRTIVTDPFDYVVFGGTGDLTRRKLLPALYQRELAGQLPSSARIIAVSHRPATTETYRQEIGSALRCTFPITEQSSRALHRFLARLSCIAADALSEEGWGALADTLQPRADCIRAFYLATAPDLFGPICDRIGAYRLITDRSRLVVEKPFGKDLASARVLNDAIGRISPK
jgi:glucose-6-phosphate 1-dehydrogenase